MNIPAVKRCAVIGVPDEKWGQVGRAYVVLHAAEQAGTPLPFGRSLLDFLRSKARQIQKFPKGSVSCRMPLSPPEDPKRALLEVISSLRGVPKPIHPRAVPGLADGNQVFRRLCLQSVAVQQALYAVVLPSVASVDRDATSFDNPSRSPAAPAERPKWNHSFRISLGRLAPHHR